MSTAFGFLKKVRAEFFEGFHLAVVKKDGADVVSLQIEGRNVVGNLIVKDSGGIEKGVVREGDSTMLLEEEALVVGGDRYGRLQGIERNPSLGIVVAREAVARGRLLELDDILLHKGGVFDGFLQLGNGRRLDGSDDIHSLEEMDRLHDAMALDFTKRMNTLKRSASYSRPTTDCLNYIYAHIRDRVTIKDLAEYTSNSTSYISRLFKEELGISASDYIRQAKVERAKNMLKYSDYSLVEISNYLSFSSQSHFIQIFQKETGMSPRKYREAYAGSIWKEEAATDT